MTANVYVSYAGLTYAIQVTDADIRVAQANLTFAVQRPGTQNVDVAQADLTFAVQRPSAQNVNIGQGHLTFAMKRNVSGGVGSLLQVGNVFLQIVIKPQYGYARAFLW